MWEICTPNALLMPAFSLPLPPPLLAVRLLRLRPLLRPEERSPTPLTIVRSHGFGVGLDPRWIVGALSHSTSELLRTP